jgi:PERQ amino acid-rich with GYF domain-containing protein
VYSAMIVANLFLVDDFVQTLLSLPAEPEILADSIYANSQTLDGRRFAEEFIRRRKLADKGIVDPITSGTLSNSTNDGKGSSGWNEVAKKGPAPKEDNNSAFKVVAPKKKGKR